MRTRDCAKSTRPVTSRDALYLAGSLTTYTMLNPWFIWKAIQNTARCANFSHPSKKPRLDYYRLSTAFQILIYLPLTLATLSKTAFLLQSLFLTIHSVIHGTLSLLWGSQALSVMQMPMHPFLLLLCFNIFSASPAPWLVTIADWWGFQLTLSGPVFIVIEGMSSLLVVQKLGQEGKKVVSRGEAYQFALLIATAVSYVISAWWMVDVGDPHFWTGFRFNYVPCLVLPSRCFDAPICNTVWSSYYFSLFPDNHWVCGPTNKHHRVVRNCTFHCLQCLALWFWQEVFHRPCIFIVRRFFFRCCRINLTWIFASAPLLPNLQPHFETLANFVITTLPKPVLMALLYRLTILQLASRILPSIGADSWDSEDGVDGTWSDRPVRTSVFCSYFWKSWNVQLRPRR